MPSSADHMQVFYDHHYDQRQQRHIFYYEEKGFDLSISVRVSLVDRPVEQRDEDKKRSHHYQFSGIKKRIHQNCIRMKHDCRNDFPCRKDAAHRKGYAQYAFFELFPCGLHFSITSSVCSL